MRAGLASSAHSSQSQHRRLQSFDGLTTQTVWCLLGMAAREEGVDQPARDPADLSNYQVERPNAPGDFGKSEDALIGSAPRTVSGALAMARARAAAIMSWGLSEIVVAPLLLSSFIGYLPSFVVICRTIPAYRHLATGPRGHKSPEWMTWRGSSRST